MYIYTHIYTHAYAHKNKCACMTPSTRWSTDTKTHNLCTIMHTHTHTHVYKRIDVQIHTHMHVYTYIMSAHIHTYTYIHTRTQNIHMNARKARLKRRRGSDCAGSLTGHQEALPFSLSASRQRAVQTTSAYLHWCTADPPSSLSTLAPRLAMPAHGPRKRGQFSAIFNMSGHTVCPHLRIVFVKFFQKCQQTWQRIPHVASC